MSRITLRLPDDLHQRLEDASRRSGISLNRMIVAALAQAIERTNEESAGDGALMDQVLHIRTALREITVEIDARRLPSQIRPEEPAAVRKRKMRPRRLVPPLSSTILEERRERL